MSFLIVFDLVIWPPINGTRSWDFGEGNYDNIKITVRSIWWSTVCWGGGLWDTTRIRVTKEYHRRGKNLNEEWFDWLIEPKNNNKACVNVRGRAELYIFMAYRLKFWAFFIRVPSLIRHTLECQNILFILEIIASNFGVHRTVSGWEIRHWQSNPA